MCASGATVNGIDVSYYQGTIDWTSAKASGIDFAYARISDGTGFIDPQFAANWANMKAAGIVRGAYQFFRPETDPTAPGELLLPAAPDPLLHPLAGLTSARPDGPLQRLT